MLGSRLSLSGLLAMGVTLALFLFMYLLISSGNSRKDELEAINAIHFGPVDIPDDIARRNRQQPPKPPPPKNPPPPPRLQVAKPEQVVQDLPRLDLPNIDNPLVGGEGIFLGNFGAIDKTAEGDIIPIVRISPMFPREAALQGISGWVRVQFTITETGTVKDPRVIDAQPPRIFNREALRAILKWKFKPRIVDGLAVERVAEQTIDFTIGEQGQ